MAMARTAVINWLLPAAVLLVAYVALVRARLRHEHNNDATTHSIGEETNQGDGSGADAILGLMVTGLLALVLAALYSWRYPSDPQDGAYLLPSLWRSLAAKHPWFIWPCHSGCAVVHVATAMAHVSGLVALGIVLLSWLPEEDEPFLIYGGLLLPSLLMTPLTHTVLTNRFWRFTYDLSAKQRYYDPTKDSPPAISSSSDSAGWRSPHQIDFFFKDLDSTALQPDDGVPNDPLPQPPTVAQERPPERTAAATPAKLTLLESPPFQPVSQFFSEDAQGFVFAAEDDVDAEDMSIGALSATQTESGTFVKERFETEEVSGIAAEINLLLASDPLTPEVHPQPSLESLLAPYGAGEQGNKDQVERELLRLSAARWHVQPSMHDFTIPDPTLLNFEAAQETAALPAAVTAQPPLVTRHPRIHVAPVIGVSHRRVGYAMCGGFTLAAIAVAQLMLKNVSSHAAPAVYYCLGCTLAVDLFVVQPLAVAVALGFRWLMTEPGEASLFDVHPLDGQWRVVPASVALEKDLDNIVG